jgi:hypothetical protein
MSEQTSIVPPPPAAGAGVVAAGLAVVVADATTGALAAADVLAVAVGLSVELVESVCVSVATVAVCDVLAVVAFDFVAGLHAAEDNATTTMAAAAERDRTCMAAPLLVRG